VTIVIQLHGSSESLGKFSRDYGKLMFFAVILLYGETFFDSLDRLVGQCELFRDPPLLATPYPVRSSVPLAIFQGLVGVLN
jgi:hypothetical protein